MPLQKRGWDRVTIITITAAVDILYIVFVVIQFAYLFGGSCLPEGFTYAEYARSGFFELILVTLLNIGLLACTLTFISKGSTTGGAAFRVLNTILICSTFVMLLSAYYRMSLYEKAYGYTFLRIMTQAFIHGVPAGAVCDNSGKGVGGALTSQGAGGIVKSLLSGIP